MPQKITYFTHPVKRPTEFPSVVKVGLIGVAFLVAGASLTAAAFGDPSATFALLKLGFGSCFLVCAGAAAAIVGITGPANQFMADVMERASCNERTYSAALNLVNEEICKQREWRERVTVALKAGGDVDRLL